VVKHGVVLRLALITAGDYTFYDFPQLPGRDHVISPDTLVIAEEFGEWEESRRRIDLLGIDKDANIVVIELKRTEDGGHMELQAIRYAAMLSTMTFQQAVEIYGRYLRSFQVDADPASTILDFLEWDEPDEDEFAQDVRIVLASAEFSKELTTSVLWLNDRGIDVRCVRLRPYADNDRVLLDVQQVIPLPEAEQYQVKVREKVQRERAARKSNRDLTKYDVTIGETTYESLPKREMVFRVIKHLCNSGVTPDEISSSVTFRQTNWYRAVEGEIMDEDAFIDRASSEAEKNDRTFDARRFYTASDELIRHNGKTYAVSNQWGGKAIKFVGQILEAFSDHNITVKPRTG
jgi:hypothetical protein